VGDHGLVELRHGEAVPAFDQQDQGDIARQVDGLIFKPEKGRKPAKRKKGRRPTGPDVR
jgi:hypothetical protein